MAVDGDGVWSVEAWRAATTPQRSHGSRRPGLDAAGLQSESRRQSEPLVARDYAAGTSSRSSKLIHGGLRDLEQQDLAPVRAARLRACPHRRTLLGWPPGHDR